MGIISKIKEIIYKVKDYDRLEMDYCGLLDYATGGVLSKPNYTMESVYEAVADHLQQHDEYVKEDYLKELKVGGIHCKVFWHDGPQLDFTQEQQDDALEKVGADVDDKVIVIILKDE
jgi:hypothetical protein